MQHRNIPVPVASKGNSYTQGFRCEKKVLRSRHIRVPATTSQISRRSSEIAVNQRVLMPKYAKTHTHTQTRVRREISAGIEQHMYARAQSV